MACTIAISSVVVNGGDVIVTGDYFSPDHCTGTLTISVKIACTDQSGNQVFCGGTGSLLGPQSGVWQAIIPCGCICGSNNVSITATASCDNPAFNCSTTAPYTLTTLCCCPSAVTAIASGPCSGNSQLVTFTTLVSIPDACTFTFRRNYGDGSLGSNQTFTGPGSFTYSEPPHSYIAPGNYTSDVEVVPPPHGCGAIDSTSVSVACAGCHSSTNLAALCMLLEWVFLASMTLALGIGFSSPCVPLTIAAGSFATGLVALFVALILQCQQCVCDFFLKYWATIFIALGFVNVMYIPPNLCVPAIAGWLAFVDAIVFFTLGFLILSVWYNNNKATCPLMICDFWCVVAGMANITSATGIAIIAIVLINAFSGGTLTLGMGVALGVVVVFASLVAMGPLNNSPCKPATPTCQ